MRLRKTYSGLIANGAMTGTILTLAVILAASVSASSFRSGKNVHISNLHQIDDDLYISAEDIQIDGSIAGDLLVAGYECNINGTIEGSAFAACRTVVVDGVVLGSLHAAGERVDISGRIDRSVLAFGAKVTFGKGASVGRDVLATGGEVKLDGRIGGNVVCSGGIIKINGIIEGNLEIESDGRINLAPSAVIMGNLTYKAAKEDMLTVMPGATIMGSKIWTEPEKEDQDSFSGADLALAVASLLAAFIFGIIVVKLFRPYAEESFVQIRSRKSISFAAGLLGILILVFVMFLLAISLILTVFAGAILLSGDSTIWGAVILIISTLILPLAAFSSVSGCIIIYSGYVLVGYLAGFHILRLFNPATTPLSKASLFVGMIVVTVLCALPSYMGAVFSLAIGLTGAGGILLGIRHCRARTQEELAPMVAASTPSDDTGEAPTSDSEDIS